LRIEHPPELVAKFLWQKGLPQKRCSARMPSFKITSSVWPDMNSTLMSGRIVKTRSANSRPTALEDSTLKCYLRRKQPSLENLLIVIIGSFRSLMGAQKCTWHVSCRNPRSVGSA
jgi:hypothetical protein